MRPRTIVFGAILVFLPSAQAQVILGTAGAPELVDEKGDVQYALTYLGPRNHDYLDITKAWLEHINETDQVKLTLVVADGSKLAAPDRSYSIMCMFTANIWTGERKTGFFQWDWSYVPTVTGSRFYHHVLFTPDPGPGARSNEPLPIHHSFAMANDTQGTYTWTSDRGAVAHFGDEARQLSANCQEVYEPVPGDAIGNATGADTAQSRAIYSLLYLRSVANADGDPEPFPTTTSEPTTGTVEPVSGTPFAGPIGVMLVLVASAILLSRRNA